MKFLVDAHLPISIKLTLIKLGHDVIHTLDLPNKNRTSDKEIETLSFSEKRIVITKDSDFVNSFLLYRCPYKLLLISTGNINNKGLEKLIIGNIDVIAEALSNYDFIELNRLQLIYHTWAV